MRAAGGLGKVHIGEFRTTVAVAGIFRVSGAIVISRSRPDNLIFNTVIRQDFEELPAIALIYDADGFITLFGLPLKVRALKLQETKTNLRGLTKGLL